MIASRKELENALELCAKGCNEEGCVYLEKANAITQERYDMGNFDSVTCIELIARDVLELMKRDGESMKYSDHPMPLKDGEYPWEQVRVLDPETRKWKDMWRQPEEADINRKWQGETPETDTYYLSGKEEYYDFETVCKACGTQFMAYTGKGIETKAVRNFCPGCGKKLATEA